MLPIRSPPGSRVVSCAGDPCTAPRARWRVSLRIDELHKRFGRSKWADLFAPVTFYAEEGFPVTELVSQSWGVNTSLQVLRMHPNSEKLYLPGGKAPDRLATLVSRQAG